MARLISRRRAHCIGLTTCLLVGFALAGGTASSEPEIAATRSPQPQAQSGQTEQDTSISPVDYLNVGRSRVGANPVKLHDGLNRLAEQYLDDIINQRDLTPDAVVAENQRVLAEDVADAIGPDGFAYRHTGLMVAYGVGLDRAVLDALENQAMHPAMLDNVMDLAGAASRTIPSGEPWLAPPVGGTGPAIELTGYTLVVIVTAGDF